MNAVETKHRLHPNIATGRRPPSPSHSQPPSQPGPPLAAGSSPAGIRFSFATGDCTGGEGNDGAC